MANLRISLFAAYSIRTYGAQVNTISILYNWFENLFPTYELGIIWEILYSLTIKDNTIVLITIILKHCYFHSCNWWNTT